MIQTGSWNLAFLHVKGMSPNMQSGQNRALMCTSLLENKMSEKLEKQAMKGEAGWVVSLCKLVTRFDQKKEENM